MSSKLRTRAAVTAGLCAALTLTGAAPAFASPTATESAPVSASDAPAGAVDTWDGSVDTSWYSAADPKTEYALSSAEQLAGLAELVNEGNSFKGATIKLSSSVDLASREWTPIGAGTRSGSSYTSDSHPFKGSFDASGTVISGLALTTAANNGNYALGLFGIVAGGSISNVVLENVNLNSSSSNLMGAVAGMICEGGSVAGCQVSGSVTGNDGVAGIVGRMIKHGTVTGCINTASVQAKTGGCAGIVAKAYYTSSSQDEVMVIEDCENRGAITNEGYHAAGIAALSAADVLHCANYGAIVGGNTSGGIVAEQVNRGAINSCANEATGTVAGGANAAGIVGWIRYQNDVSSYPQSEPIAVTGNINKAVVGKSGDGEGLGWGGIVGTVYNCATVAQNENQAGSITGGAFAAGVVGNLQKNEDNLYYGDGVVEVENNVSTTPMEAITGKCKDEFAYKNDTSFSVSENSGAWIGTIGSEKIATLPAALELAKAQKGDVAITLSADVDLTPYVAENGTMKLPGADLSSSEISKLTIKGGAQGVKLVSGVDGNGIDGAPYCPVLSIKLPSASTLTISNLVIPNDLGFDSPGAAVTVEGCELNGSISGYPWCSSISFTGNKFEFAGTADKFYSGNAYAVWYKVDKALDFTFVGNTVEGPRGVHIETRGNGSSNITVKGNKFTLKDSANDKKRTALQLVANQNGNVEFVDNYVDGYEGVCLYWGIAHKSGKLTIANNYVVDGGKLYGSNDWKVEATQEELDSKAEKYVNSLGDDSSISKGHTEHKYGQDGTCTICGEKKPTPPSGGGGTVIPSDKTEVEKNPDGSTTTTVTKPDGSQTITHETATGTESVVKKDKDGNVTSTEVTVSKKDAESGKVELPIADTEPGSDVDKAPEVEVKVPASVSDKAPVQVTVPVAKDDDSEPNYGIVVFAVDEDGNETVIPKCTVDDDGNVAFEASGDVTIKVVDNAKDMPDVKETDWFAGDVVDFATARGIVNGVALPDGFRAFDGYGRTSRGMFVAMLHNLELNPEAASEGSLADVPAGAFYADAAAWALGEGILSGVDMPDGSKQFQGEAAVTREQVAVFLMRYADHLGMDVSARAEIDFPDASEVSGFAKDAMSWAVAEGLFTGDDVTGELNPTDGAARAEVATVLMRFINLMYA